MSTPFSADFLGDLDGKVLVKFGIAFGDLRVRVPQYNLGAFQTKWFPELGSAAMA